MSNITAMKGGEVLTDGGTPGNGLVDMRYFSFNPVLNQNLSTQESEYVQHDVKNIDSNILEWNIDPTSSGYIDLKESFFQIKYKIRDDDGTPNNAAYVKPLTSILFFKNFKTYLNNRDVSDMSDGGLAPYSAFHKMCLMEEGVNQPKVLMSQYAINKLNNPTTYTTNVSDLASTDVDHRAVYEGIYDVGDIYFDTAVDEQPSLTAYQILQRQLGRFNGSGTELVVKPRDAIWQQDKFLPPETQIRILGEINKDLALVTSQAKHTHTSGMNFVIASATLYLRRVYPTEATELQLKQLSISVPRSYPLVRARTTYFNVGNGTSSIAKTGLLAGSRPSVLCVQFVPLSHFNADTYGTFQFWGGWHNNTHTEQLSVSSLFCRVGSQRYPKNYEYGHTENNVIQDADAYYEYLRMCKGANGELVQRPFLTPASKTYNIYFINTRQNGESMFDMVDDPTALDSIEIHARFNSSLAQDYVCVVSALTNDLMTIDQGGRVNIL